MIDAKDMPGLQDEFTYFQEQSLAVISVFAASLGYLWFVWLLTPMSDAVVPISVWGSIGLLQLCCGASYFLKTTYLTAARRVLIAGIVVAATAAAITFPPGVGVYLFIIPIQAASVLLSTRGFWAVVILDLLLVVIIAAARAGNGLSEILGAITIPLAIIGLVTVVTWQIGRAHV